MKANVQISAVKKEFKNGQQGWQVFVEGMEGKLRCEMNFHDALKAIRYSFLLSKKLNLQINEVQLTALSLDYQQAKEAAKAQVAEAATEVAQEVAAEAEQGEPSDEKSEAPEEVALGDSPIFKQFCDLKKKHPDSLLLFRRGDFYECYEEDAIKAAEVLCLTQVHNTKDNITMAGFPHHALDTYLPRLIRHGIRVAICDDITDFCKPASKREKSELASISEREQARTEFKPAKHNESANAVQQELFTNV